MLAQRSISPLHVSEAIPVRTPYNGFVQPKAPTTIATSGTGGSSTVSAPVKGTALPSPPAVNQDLPGSQSQPSTATSSSGGILSGLFGGGGCSGCASRSQAVASWVKSNPLILAGGFLLVLVIVLWEDK